MLDNQLFALLLFFFVVLGFLSFLVVLAQILGPKNPTKTKQLPFECGAVPVGEARDERFYVRFYLVAMVFILFDIEVIFMYPWAVLVRELGWIGLLEMGFFFLIASLGFVYIWKRGLLDWNKQL